MEDLARKLAAFGLLDPNHHALSISKKQYCASPPPILPPPALGLSSPFQVRGFSFSLSHVYAHVSFPIFSFMVS